jgi:uncharacterized cofD-like protein
MNSSRVLLAFRSRLRWLVPGMGVKRWILALLFGGLCLSLALGSALETLYAWLPGLGTWVRELVDALTLRDAPSWARTLLFGVGGAAITLWALRAIKQNLLAPFMRPGLSISKAVSDHRRRGRGPKVVAIGGGTGLSTLLRGLKHHTSNLTAIVTVADDGGSSGRLRRSLGVLPPGDFRNCIAALADDESLLTQLFQYRFGARAEADPVRAVAQHPDPSGRPHSARTGDGLGGHSFGNLFITAMAEVAGSFERALLESSSVLAIHGQVLPSTLRDVTLVGELVDEGAQVSRVEGESRITVTPGAIRRVYLQPDDAPAYPGAIRALLDADLIVLGPGSLYTSLMPNLLVRDLAEAIRASRAIKVHVCNTATQPGETDGYSVLDHVHAIERHTWPGLFPLVFANSRQEGTLLPNLQWVRLDSPLDGERQVLVADLADEERPWRHDSGKLANALMRLLVNAPEADVYVPQQI